MRPGNSAVVKKGVAAFLAAALSLPLYSGGNNAPLFAQAIAGGAQSLSSASVPVYKTGRMAPKQEGRDAEEYQFRPEQAEPYLRLATSETIPPSLERGDFNQAYALHGEDGETLLVYLNQDSGVGVAFMRDPEDPDVIRRSLVVPGESGGQFRLISEDGSETLFQAQRWDDVDGRPVPVPRTVVAPPVQPRPLPPRPSPPAPGPLAAGAAGGVAGGTPLLERASRAPARSAAAAFDGAQAHPAFLAASMGDSWLKAAMTFAAFSRPGSFLAPLQAYVLSRMPGFADVRPGVPHPPGRRSLLPYAPSKPPDIPAGGTARAAPLAQLSASARDNGFAFSLGEDGRVEVRGGLGGGPVDYASRGISFQISDGEIRALWRDPADPEAQALELAEDALWTMLRYTEAAGVRLPRERSFSEPEEQAAAQAGLELAAMNVPPYLAPADASVVPPRNSPFYPGQDIPPVLHFYEYEGGVPVATAEGQSLLRGLERLYEASPERAAQLTSADLYRAARHAFNAALAERQNFPEVARAEEDQMFRQLLEGSGYESPSAFPARLAEDPSSSRSPYAVLSGAHRDLQRELETALADASLPLDERLRRAQSLYDALLFAHSALRTPRRRNTSSVTSLSLPLLRPLIPGESPEPDGAGSGRTSSGGSKPIQASLPSPLALTNQGGLALLNYLSWPEGDSDAILHLMPMGRQLRDLGYDAVLRELHARGMDPSQVRVAVLDGGWADNEHPELAGRVHQAASSRYEGAAGAHATHVATPYAALGFTVYSYDLPMFSSDDTDQVMVNGLNAADRSFLAFEEAVRDAVENRGARVVNMSWHSGDHDARVTELMDRYTEEYGVIFVAAAGNDHHMDNFNDMSRDPAIGEHTFLVAATDGVLGTGSGFTSFGGILSFVRPTEDGRYEIATRQVPTIAAPGRYYGARPTEGSSRSSALPWNEDYVSMQGTSMAAPMAGAALALLEHYAEGFSREYLAETAQRLEPELGPVVLDPRFLDRVHEDFMRERIPWLSRQAVEETATPVIASEPSITGAGQLDVDAAAEWLQDHLPEECEGLLREACARAQGGGA